MGPFFLTGASGQVGGELEPLLGELGEVWAPRREELDLSRLDDVRAYLRARQPRWIVNPAAYTAVDKAEQDRETADRLNAELPRVLGEEAVRLGAVVIHFSTDYVFSGAGTAAFTESDLPAPINVYGASKLAGERALAQTGAAHFIFRTCWVYAAAGKNFLRTILRFAAERDELKIVSDQIGAPTWARDLARLAVYTIRRHDQDGRALESAHAASGIYHACSQGETSWFGFASEFVRIAQENEPMKPWAKLTPIRTEEYPTPAKRPFNSRLDCRKLEDKLAFSLPRWQDSLSAVMKQIYDPQDA